MKILIPILATLCLSLWGNIAAGEDDQATLVADEVTVDGDESRNEDIQEYTFDSKLKLHQDWTVQNSFRYDLIANKVATAGLGLEYDAQCFNIDVSATRRFTESGTSPPQTTFQLTVALKGFSTGGASRPRNTSCRN
jgi:LPS-assembly protein